MNIPTIFPPRLRRGDTIGLVAPAGSIENRDAFEQGIATLRRLGFNVRFDDRIFESLRYLAGSDNARAEELMRSFEDPGVRAIMCLRGGFGSSRLIPLLDEGRIRTHPKLFIGFSDVTTLHLYFNQRFRWVTLHGPMAVSPTLANLSAEQEKHLVSIWTDSHYLPRLSFPQLQTWFSGVAEGKLVGGCLSLIVASLGTPYEINTIRKILFLEDQGEPPYRVDRMLTQLRLSGKFDSISGLLLGNFLNCDSTTTHYNLEDVLRDCLGFLQVPILSGFPAGHGQHNWALPLGIRVRIDGRDRAIEFLESSVT